MHQLFKKKKMKTMNENDDDEVMEEIEKIKKYLIIFQKIF